MVHRPAATACGGDRVACRRSRVLHHGNRGSRDASSFHRFPGLPASTWRDRLAPDAVSTRAVLERVKLPRRLQILLVGESLLDDASGPVLFRFGVATATKRRSIERTAEAQSPLRCKLESTSASAAHSAFSRASSTPTRSRTVAINTPNRIPEHGVRAAGAGNSERGVHKPGQAPYTPEACELLNRYRLLFHTSYVVPTRRRSNVMLPTSACRAA